MTGRTAKLTLENSAWLSRIPDDLRRPLLDAGINRRCDARTVLWRFGDPVDGLYGLLSGLVRIDTAWTTHGPTMLNTFHEGSWLGEAEFLSGAGRITSLTALRPCRFLFIPRASVMALAEARPELWRGIGFLAFEKLALAVASLDDLMIRESDQRLAAVLLRLSGARLGLAGEAVSTGFDVTQTELGQLANLSRSVVSRLLERMEGDGLIRCGYGRIEIIDLDALRRAAGAEAPAP